MVVPLGLLDGDAGEQNGRRLEQDLARAIRRPPGSSPQERGHRERRLPVEPHEQVEREPPERQAGRHAELPALPVSQLEFGAEGGEAAAKALQPQLPGLWQFVYLAAADPAVLQSCAAQRSKMRCARRSDGGGARGCEAHSASRAAHSCACVHWKFNSTFCEKRH